MSSFSLQHSFENSASFLTVFLWIVFLWFPLVLKIWFNFCFAYYVGNLTLIGVISFTGAIYFFFSSIFFLMHIDNWFDIPTAAITDFNIIPVEIFYGTYACLENVFELIERNICQCCCRCSLKKVDWTRWCFFCDLWVTFIFIWFNRLFVLELLLS